MMQRLTLLREANRQDAKVAKSRTDFNQFSLLAPWRFTAPDRRPFRRVLALVLTLRCLCLTAMLFVTGCSMVPTYQRPATTLPVGFKEAPGWRPAAPADGQAREKWWTWLRDGELDALQARVLISNQNLAAATAAYDQARAVVQEQRSALFPSVDLQASATRAGSFAKGTTVVPGAVVTGGASGGVSSNGAANASRRYSASVGASWEVDVFGRLRASAAQAGALAEASAADLANAALAARGELALDYVQLRAIDAQADILEAAITGYERALQIANNRYAAGVVGRVDVLQAETQLYNARADAADLGRQRAALEHAIAVLVGENPSLFTLGKTDWSPQIPEVPIVLPSALLERRPDIASAERRVAAANAAVGIERSAYFPTLNLTGSAGFSSSSLSSLFDVASSVWSLGATGLMTLLDFGGRAARVAQARAAYEQTVAEYRQTVLVAFQQTEDQLAAVRVLEQVEKERAAATSAANQAEQITLNQYAAGVVSYSDVILAQATALSARQASVTTTLNRQTAAIALIQAIGGYWDGNVSHTTAGGSDVPEGRSAAISSP
jgi:NodT family efflux transporter outer membrane factor (OMF) lipoprotein